MFCFATKGGGVILSLELLGIIWLAGTKGAGLED